MTSHPRSKLVFCAISLLIIVAPALAQEVTEDEIFKALSPQKTRSLSIGAPTQVADPADTKFVDALRNRDGQAVSAEARDKLKTLTADKPTKDLSMEFGFRSDVLRGESLRVADKLGRVLGRPEFANQTFVIAGHTDAKGSDSVNQKLSERRAEAVKSYLVRVHRLPAANLVAVGYGKSQLKNASNPSGSENRRVQAVNMLQVKTAGR